MKKFNKKLSFIIFSIIFAVILISIFSANIIIKKINDNTLKASETNARNRLNTVLALASSEKENNTQYNNESFLTSILTSNGLIVNGNIVSLDNWNFEIDRENLSITNNLGPTLVTLTDELLKVLSATSANFLVKIKSNINIDKIIIENNDGSFNTENINSTYFEKDICINLDKVYTISIITSDGKTSIKKLSKNIVDLKDPIFIGNESLLAKVSNDINESGYHTINCNDESYDIHSYVYYDDLVISSNTYFGDVNDVGSSYSNAKNMIILKVNGNLIINERSYIINI